MSASTVGAVTTTAAEHPVRARLSRWPHEPDVAHVVLLDHHMVPDRDAVESWIAAARAGGSRALRTGALFPPSTPAFLAAGFAVIDTLSLLELDLGASAVASPPSPSMLSGIRLRRLRPSNLAAAAIVDHDAFDAPWSNDAAALTDVMAATPHHRARFVQRDRQMVAFSISGRASNWGYVQRLAVEPSARRNGLATLLLVDAIDWMRRRHVTRVLVNTATDNAAALALYRSHGFVDQHDRLTILERTLLDR